MLELVVSLLKEAGVFAWELSDVTTQAWEFYFIRHELDQNRVRDVEHVTLKVYQLSEDGSSLGSASCELAQGADEAELRAQIEALAYRASLVKNRPYTLQPPREAPEREVGPVDMPALARAFLETLRSLPESEESDVNSYELFLSHKHRRLLTSAGIDVEESWPSCLLELVTNARRDGREIELCRQFHSGGCDAESLRRDLERMLRIGRDRLRAVPTPALGTADVLFSGANAAELYRFFSGRLSAAAIYRKLSDWKLGEPVCRDFRGDRPSLTALRELPNSSRNRRYDAEGAPIRDTLMLENGVARAYLGGRMFSAYLGLDDSFSPTNFAVSGGTRSEEELRRGPCLEVVDFSDFQVDVMTGDLFGEIRLAYWHDGERVTPVSGGSISGSMLDLAGEMYLSRERQQFDNWLIPAATLVRGVTVTGIE